MKAQVKSQIIGKTTLLQVVLAWIASLMTFEGLVMELEKNLCLPIALYFGCARLRTPGSEKANPVRLMPYHPTHLRR